MRAFLHTKAQLFSTTEARLFSPTSARLFDNMFNPLRKHIFSFASWLPRRGDLNRLLFFKAKSDESQLKFTEQHLMMLSKIIVFC